MYICNSSEFGLGGFATHGRAWSYQIPQNLRNRAHINILEYLSQIITRWINILENTTKKKDCIVSIGDNTSAMS